MKIALIQAAPIQGDIHKNLKTYSNLIGKGDGSDIYILPEMFSTGQYIDPTPVIQDMNGETIIWMKETAHCLNAAVAGSVAIKENGHFFNRFCFVTPEGKVTQYDKHHLFSYSGENLKFTAGKERVCVEFRGLRILLQICYDLRFPIYCRNRNDYDAIIFVANWPLKRLLAWDTLIRARAIENQCFVLAVNRIGDDEYGHYTGHSSIIGPYGDTVLIAPDDTECIVSATLDIDRLNRFREKFPVLEDAD